MLVRWLYSLALALFFVLYLPVFLFKTLRSSRGRHELADRFGFVPRLAPAAGRRIWVHAVSVGELLAAQPLLKELHRETFSLVLSTTTTTGNHLARQLFGQMVEAVIFFPFDFSGCSGRSLDRLRPDLFIMMETEIWPNFLWNCQRRGVTTLMVNGRISDRSFTRYLLIQKLLAPSLQRVQRFCVQTHEDCQRLVRLGAPADRVCVTGNMKYDVIPERHPEVLNRLIREVLGIGSKVPLLVAGSTAEGEEKILLESLQQVRRQGILLKMVLAPRHPQRFDEVARLLAESSLTYTRRSFFTEQDLAHWLKSEVQYDVFLLDSMGDLATVYETATVVFVGKSLVLGGGQNILEPAYYGRPILFGPSMDNFREVADNFLKHHAAIQVSDGEDLTRQLVRLLLNRDLRTSLGARAGKIIADNRGAAVQTLDEIRRLVTARQQQASGRP